MKTSTKIYAAIAASAVMATAVGYASAMQGQGNGQGQGIGRAMTTEQRSAVRDMTQTERQSYMQGTQSHSGTMMRGSGNGQRRGNGSSMKSAHNPGDTIKDIVPSSLSNQEKLDLAYQYREEMVARDAYNYFYTLYNVQTFKNIASSEQQHMDAVKVLLDRYSLDTPTGYGELTATFTTLKAEGEKGLKEALEVGLKIEMLDIKDITDTIKTTDNDDLKIVFSHIGGASYNHMRGFIKALANNGFTTAIDYSSYLTQADLNTRGSLQSKLSDRLSSQGVVLPVLSNVGGAKDGNGNKNKTMGRHGNAAKNTERTQWQ